MANRALSALCGCLALLSGTVGCSGVEESDDVRVATRTQAAVGVDEYLYLRCNATGWGADGTTLLTPGGRAGLFVLEYSVSADWMVGGGDQCVITRTNSRNGWGSSSTTYGAAAPGVVTVPGGWRIGAANSAYATVRYPALGRYRATVDWNAGSVTIAAVAPMPPAPTDAYYLRCNATGWGADGATKLTPGGQAGVLVLEYSVSADWMVSGGDQCVITRTNNPNGWGSSNTTYGAATPGVVTVPGTWTIGAANSPYATIRYPALGRYQASFEPTTGRVRIGAPGSSTPPTGLHGKVESLGGNRVRVTYDFQTAEQLQDFAPTDAASTAVSLVDGRLVVRNLSAVETLNMATLVKGFQIDSLQYEAELLAGDHINVYVGTIWNGSWSPVRGYGAIHRDTGRLFGVNGGLVVTGDWIGVVPGKRYRGRIDTSERGLTWTLDGNAQPLVFPYYGGTTRTLLVGGNSSTTAFDNLVLEGTVQGMESDGTETTPGVIHGSVDALPGGRVRIRYDFSDPQQKYDFAVNSAAGTRRELNDGRLIVGHASDASVLKVALSKYRMRVDRLAYRAELLTGSHVNVYWNTTWDENWAPLLGCGAIHREQGRLFVANGAATATSDATPVALRTPYLGELLPTDTRVSWTLGGLTVAQEAPCNAATGGNLGLGSYASDVAFDDLVIEGRLE